MLCLVFLTLGGVSLLAAGARNCHADSDFGKAKLVISNRPGEHIPVLHWNRYDYPVHVVSKNDTRQAYVTLSGSLDRSDVDLVFDQSKLALTPNPNGTGVNFTQKVPLTGEITLLSFYMVDPYGRTQQEKVALVFPQWREFSLPLTKLEKSTRRWFYSAGLGLSYEDYNEPQNISLVEYALTGKVNAVYLLKPDKWEVGGNAFLNLLPVSHTPSDREPARWYGVNGRIGYHLPIRLPSPSTSLWLMTGWYMWGMYVNAPPETTYGVAYLTGPQIFITARFAPPGGHAGWVYFKYASISDTSALLSLANREWAVGAGRQISRPGAPHPLSLTLDIADAKYANSQTDQSFHLFSASLGVSVGL